MYLKLLLENQTSLSYKEAIKRIISAPLYLENTAVVETVDDLKSLVSSHSKELSKDDGAIDIREDSRCVTSAGIFKNLSIFCVVFDK